MENNQLLKTLLELFTLAEINEVIDHDGHSQKNKPGVGCFFIEKFTDIFSHERPEREPALVVTSLQILPLRAVRKKRKEICVNTFRQSTINDFANQLSSDM